MFEGVLGYTDGLRIELKTIIVSQYTGIKYLPSLKGFSSVAAIGVSGVATVKRGQKIDNPMNLGDFVRKVISWKKCRFKKEKDAHSLDLYRAYQQNEAICFGFVFTVQDGDYLQKALFTVTPTRITDYLTDASPVPQVQSWIGLEAVEFEFEEASVDYPKELDPMFLYRVEEQRKKILRLITG